MCVTIIITILLITLNSIDNINGENDYEPFQLSSDHINFCSIGADFQKELVYSLVHEYQYAYFVKLARLYRDGRKHIVEIEKQIKGLRNRNFKGKDRQDNWLYFKGHTIDLNATFRKTYQELDEMTNNVQDGISQECAIHISNSNYVRAAKMLVDAGNDGLIYSILHLLYLITEKTEELFLDYVFKFNQQLLDNSYHMRASTVYLCSFSILVGDKKMFTHSMVRLAQYSQITSRYLVIASRDLQKYDYIKLKKRYAYIRTGSPTGIQILVWSANKIKCIVNKKFNEILIMEPPQRVGDGKLYTQNYTDFNNVRCKWNFEFNIDEDNHRIINGGQFMHLSNDVVGGLPKIMVSRTYDKDADGWKMIPIGNNEFHIENSETRERIIAGPDFEFTRENFQRRVFGHRNFQKLEDNYLTGIDVWIIHDC